MTLEKPDLGHRLIVINRLSRVLPKPTSIPRARSAGAIRRSSLLSARGVLGQRADAATLRDTSRVRSSTISAATTSNFATRPVGGSPVRPAAPQPGRHYTGPGHEIPRVLRRFELVEQTIPPFASSLFFCAFAPLRESLRTPLPIHNDTPERSHAKAQKNHANNFIVSSNSNTSTRPFLPLRLLIFARLCVPHSDSPAAMSPYSSGSLRTQPTTRRCEVSRIKTREKCSQPYRTTRRICYLMCRSE